MTVTKKSGIFIHSRFGTGSTYFWNTFRQNQNDYGYDKPFHRELEFLDGEDVLFAGYRGQKENS